MPCLEIFLNMALLFGSGEQGAGESFLLIVEQENPFS